MPLAPRRLRRSASRSGSACAPLWGLPGIAVALGLATLVVTLGLMARGLDTRRSRSRRSASRASRSHSARRARSRSAGSRSRSRRFRPRSSASLVYANDRLRIALARPERRLALRAKAALSAPRAHHGRRRAGRLVSRGAPARARLRRRRRRARPSPHGDLADVRDRVELVAADLLDQSALAALLRMHRPTEVYNLASPSFVPRSWEYPVETAEFAAVGVTSLLEAVRARRRRDPRLPGVVERDLRRARRGAADGVDPARARDAVRRREGLRALHRRLVPPPLRPARERAGSSTTTSRRGGPRPSCRARSRMPSPRSRAARERALARRSRRTARLGLRARLRRGDVADAPAGRAGRLRDRDGRAAQRAASSSRSRSRTSASTGTTHVRVDESLKRGQAELHRLVGDASKARSGSAGSRRSPSTSSSRCWWTRRRMTGYVPLNERRHRAHAKLLAAVGTGNRVLDVGCSSGYLAEPLSERGNTIVGLELDPAAAREAERFCERVLVGDVETMELPLEPASFDVVLCGDVVEHLREPVAALARLRPFLKPGGRLVLSTPNIANWAIRLSLLARSLAVHRPRHPRPHAHPSLHPRDPRRGARAGRLPSGAARLLGARAGRLRPPRRARPTPSARLRPPLFAYQWVATAQTSS